MYYLDYASDDMLSAVDDSESDDSESEDTIGKLLGPITLLCYPL